MYTSTTCVFCTRAKRLLAQLGVDSVEEIDVSDSRESMIQRTGRMTVPQIYIGEHHVGGFDELVSLHRAGKLAPLLRDAES